MAPRLKVFTWSDGFHAYSVATSSRAKALEAWGISRDMFRDGEATEVTDGPDREAALKSPGKVVERGLAIDLGEAKPLHTAAKPSRAATAAKARLAQLKADLDALDQAHDAAGEALSERRRVLEEEADDLETRHHAARTALLKRIKAARAVG